MEKCLHGLYPSLLNFLIGILCILQAYKTKEHKIQITDSSFKTLGVHLTTGSLLLRCNHRDAPEPVLRFVPRKRSAHILQITTCFPLSA